MIEVAMKYHLAGYRVVPIGDDKRALCKWSEFQQSQTIEQVEEIFSKSNVKGIAVITGVDGLECIDIDLKYDSTGTLFGDYVKYIETFDSVEVQDLMVQSTPSGGFHFFYKCPDPGNNQKLAKQLDANEKPVTVIETRGKGGYVLVHPSKGYEFQTLDLLAVPTITQDQRNVIINSAKALNQVIEYRDLPKVERQVKNFDPSDKETCWDAYNRSDDFLQLLYDRGWSDFKETPERMYLRRPGKDRGNSGDFNKQKRLFKSWSVNTAFEEGRAYTPFGVYCELMHMGNSSKAAKELYSKGWGERLERTTTTEIGATPEEIKQVEQEKEKTILEKLEERRFSIKNKPRFVKSCFGVSSNGTYYDVAGAGMICAFVGKSKSRKTTALALGISSDLSGGEVKVNFKMDLEGKDILYFDTEQSEYFNWATNERILKMAGLKEDHERFYSYDLRPYLKSERMEMISAKINSMDNLGLVVIDGIKDICRNFNDIEDSEKVIQKLMTWSSETGALIMPVLHTNKGDGSMRGHLGSFLGDKADAVIEVVLNSDTGYSEVRPKMSRYAPFPPFQFTQTKEGMPILEYSLFDVTGKHQDNAGDLELEVVNEEQVRKVNENLITKPKKRDPDDIPF